MPFRIWLPAVMLASLCACQAPQQEPSLPAAEVRVPWDVYQQAEAGQARVYRLDAERSAIRIHVYRAGRLAARGHNHVVTAPVLEGAVLVPETGTAGARFDLAVSVAELAVDDPAVRRELGGSFASDVDDEARRGTRANMLGAQALDAERFPFIGASSRAVVGELPKLVILTAITLHGVSREQWVPVTVHVDPERMVAEGALAVRQSDFGIEPFSALGGLLRVDDTLMIEFHLVGAPD